jgi:hypothetical protein
MTISRPAIFFWYISLGFISLENPIGYHVVGKYGNGKSSDVLLGTT